MSRDSVHALPARCARAAAIACALLAAAAAQAFDFDDVAERARRLAAAPYAPPKAPPEWLQQVGYDQHRGIRYRLDEAVWYDEGGRFQITPLMPGSVYRTIVPINIVDGDLVEPIPFEKERFTFDEEDLKRRIPDDLGYAGFEVSYPLNRPRLRDKFLVFGGASYFRAVGAGDQWGLSVRGAAIDTGLVSGEEFPNFVEFWIVRPNPRAPSLTIYALLDSPRLTGAYEYVVAPGAPTRLEVRTVLHARQRIELLGIAPLTSMYYYGENAERPWGEWRPEVHDSDGLLVEDPSGARSWHPLLRTTRVQLDDTPLRDGGAFALLQRDTRFAAYEDAGADYQRRPSARVELEEGFDPGGRVVLVQIPTGNEYMDNVVAFWSPPGPVDARSRLELRYTISVGRAENWRAPNLGEVVNTFVGRNHEGGGARGGTHRFIVDFEGGPLAQLDEDAPVVARLRSETETPIVEHQIERVAQTGRWRLYLLINAPEGKPLSVSAELAMRDRPLTETWVYEQAP